MDFSYDAVVIGGAFSGASAALLLKRRRPATRVLIIERALEFDRKVGESTTEVSSCFLTKVLGISTWLGHHQLAKQGLWMWFARTPGEKFEDCVELGARYNSRLSGFQVDRATLDERHSTRGRGNALRLAITGQFSADGEAPAWNDRETLATLDLCLSCKACKSECPSNVDIAKLKAEYLGQSYANGVSGFLWSIGLFNHCQVALCIPKSVA